MIEPSIEELLDKRKNPEISSKFELITLISRRAKQVNNNAQILTQTDDVKPVSIAMREISAGRILPVKKKANKG